MIITDKSTYTFLEETTYLPYYLHSWYLDAMTETWTPFVLLDKDKNPRAVFIRPASQKYFMKFSAMPQLTPYGGLHIMDTTLTTVEIKTLINTAKKGVHFLEHAIHPAFAEYVNSDRQKTTYLIAPTDEETSWKNLKSDYRRKCKKASEALSIKSIDVEDLWPILEASFRQKKQPNPYNQKSLFDLVALCSEHDNVSLLGTYSQKDELTAVAIYTDDEKYTYYLGGGHLQQDNAMYLLLWEGIKQSMTAGRTFDFEGSDIPGVAQFFRGFGGEEVKYPVLQHYGSGIIKRLVELKRN